MGFIPKQQEPQQQITRICPNCKVAKPLIIQFWDKARFGSWSMICKVCVMANNKNKPCNCLKK